MLKDAINASGMKRSWLADQCGISRVTLWRYETGELELPKATRKALARALRVPAKTLVEVRS